MKNLVIVSGIEVYAYHGCLGEEEVLGGKYIVDVELDTDFSQSAQTDQLTDTIDYAVVREIVVEEMQIPSKLIEHVGYRIQQRFKAAFNKLNKSRITVRKLNPPIKGAVKEVAIVIEG